MRVTPLALACCAALLGLTIAGTARADAVKATPELTVFSAKTTRSADGRPLVLRGSATRRGTVDGRYGSGSYAPAGLQFGAGAKLWMTDPETGRVIVCDERRTSRVGSRFIGCLEDRLPSTIYE
ncbi:MAG: hypothetical protein R3F54_20225 [Alphaproteobacteria bacterium]